MKLPQSLNAYNVTKENIEEFKGLDHNERAQNGAWYDMENMTLDDYPVASVRNKRGIVTSDYENTISNNDLTIQTRRGAFDAAIVNGNVSLLQNCAMQQGGTVTAEGQILKDTQNAVYSFAKSDIEGTITYQNNLLKEFQDKWCFYGRGEPICNIYGRWFEYRTKDSISSNDICLGAIITTTDDGAPWTFPMLISKKESAIKIYYNDAFFNEQINWNETFKDCTYIKEYTDKHGEKWYVSQNAAAFNLGDNVDNIKTLCCGKAQYLGIFNDWKSAAQTIIDIYNDESNVETQHYFYTTGLKKVVDNPIHAFTDDDYKYLDIKNRVSKSKLYMQFDDYQDYYLSEDQIANFSEMLLNKWEKATGMLYCDNITKLYPYVEEAVNEYYEAYQGDFAKKKGSQVFYYSDKNGAIHNADERKFGCYVLNKQYVESKYDIEIVFAIIFYKEGNLWKHKMPENVATPHYELIANTTPLQFSYVVDLSGIEKDANGYDVPKRGWQFKYNLICEFSSNIKSVLSKDNSQVDIEGELFSNKENIEIIRNKNAYLINTSVINLDWACKQQNAPSVTNVKMSGSLIADNQNVKNIETLKSANYGEKKALIKCGKKILVVPDGVIIDTDSGKVSKIAYKDTFSVNKENKISSVICTCDGDENTFNANIYSINSNSNYRIVSGTLQKKVKLNDNSTLWTDISSYVSFYYNEAERFDKFSKGDNVEFSIKFSADCQLDLTKFKKGLFEYDSATRKLKTNNYRINKVGNNFIDFSAPLINYEKNENEWLTGFTNNDTKFDITIEKKFPDVMPFGCLCGNRVWLCQKDGHEIYASALGDYTNYYDFSGLNSDSWAANVGSDGRFTGIVNYLGNVLVFKEDTLYIVYGSIPSEFSYTEVNNFKGVEEGSERSFAIIDNVLYYKSVYGIIAYDGSTTVISSALGRDKYKNAVAGAWGNKYYVSMQNVKTNEYELFCYDTKKGMWTKETEEKISRFINNGNTLYYVTEKQVKIVDADNDYDVLEDKINWSVETGVYGYSYPNQKYVSRFQLRMYLAQGAKARFYIQYNSSGKWESCGKEIIGRGINSFVFPIRPRRCDHMKFKIEGEGECKIYSLTKCLEVGGEL